MDVKQDYNTKARRYISEYLESKGNTTVSAQDIISYLKKKGENVSFTTVYRYLNKLSAEHKVIKFSKGDGRKTVYKAVKNEDSCDEHIHIQCIRCGKLAHLDCGFMNSFREHLFEKHRFTLSFNGSILYGVCDECTKTKDI